MSSFIILERDTQIQSVCVWRGGGGWGGIFLIKKNILNLVICNNNNNHKDMIYPLETFIKDNVLKSVNEIV